MKPWNKDSKGDRVANLFGILLAFGIAFGGLSGVQVLIAREEQRMLQGSGVVEILSREDSVEVSESGQAAKVKLSETELVQAAEILQSSMEIYPHEPQQGQLSMAQAIECSKKWMEDFFLAHFGMSGANLQEYRANCCLWSPQENEADKRGLNGADSYWTVVLGGKGIEAELILHGESGQILEASVSCLLSSEAQNYENVGTFLQKYVDSFGFMEHETLNENRKGIPENNSQTIYQSIGSEGVYAAMETSLVVISVADSEDNALEGSFSEDMEIFYLQLYLDIAKHS